MADPDIVSIFSRRLELALQDGHYDRAHRIIDEAERESSSPPEPITLDTSLADVGLPVRVVATLDRHGIRTIGDALAKTPGQLAAVPSIGATSLRTIIATLRALPITTG